MWIRNDLTYVGKFSIFEYHKVVFLAQFDQLVYQVGIKILEDVYVCLIGVIESTMIFD